MNKLFVPIGMLVTAVILITAGILAKNQEAFLFPNIVATAMLTIAVLTIFYSRKESFHAKSNSIPWLNILPALIIFIAYLATLETIGFYLCSFIAFVAIVSIYHPAATSFKSVIKIALTGLIFMSALYCLFTLLLRVQVPRGIFF